jgi:chromosome segregation ATPase
MDDELGDLERKVDALIGRVEALREANAALERELAGAREQNRVLAARMRAASARLDALIARLPTDTVPP